LYPALLIEYRKPEGPPQKFIPLSQFTLKTGAKYADHEFGFVLYSINGHHNPIYFDAGQQESFEEWHRLLCRQVGIASEVDWEKEAANILEALPDGAMVVTDESEIANVNQSFCQMFEFQPSDLIGHNLSVLLPPGIEHHDSLIQRHLESGRFALTNHPHQVPLQSGQGNPIRTEMSVTELPPNDLHRLFLVKCRWRPAAPREQREETQESERPHNFESVKNAVSEGTPTATPDHPVITVKTPRQSHQTTLVPATLALSTHSSQSTDSTIDEELAQLSDLINNRISRTSQGIITDVARHIRTLKQAISKAALEREQLEKRLTRLKVYSSSAESARAHGANSSSSSPLPSGPSNKIIYIDRSNPIVGASLASSGGSGTAIHSVRVDGWQCVVKELHIVGKTPDELALFESEIMLLESLPKHRNLVRYLFHNKLPTKYQLFITRYDASLADIIRQRRREQRPFTLHQVVMQLIEICQGVAVLHQHEIVHRDLKSDNILVLLDESHEIARLVVSDFDSARRLSADSKARTVIGTAGYMAPEILTSSSYSYPVDIWSLGMIIYEFMFLEPPWADPMHAIEATIKKSGIPCPQHLLSSDLAKLIPIFEACCSYNPSLRPSISWLLGKLPTLLI
jgi:PAS domain S-box-containing protein